MRNTLLILREFRPIQLTAPPPSITLQAMPPANLDQLRLAYKQATDEWIAAIRAEEALATPDHSMTAWEKWDDAHFREHDAHPKFTQTREAYKSALRTLNIGI
ncbi:MAG: hypothetical protein WAM78_04320 [Candidatus Sulfotelmatobacter sp.]